MSEYFQIALHVKWQPTPILLAGKSHGQRSLVSYSLWGHKELDMIEPLHFRCVLNQGSPDEL